ncbi:MAG: ankyrin repeat domain-containing protein [Gammaproteobacteria bacterium]
MKQLFYQFGADLRFAQDYLNSKLIGHRYELVGRVDIVNAKGHFIEIDFEGFFLEFTLGIIESSLRRYKNNFAAREVRDYFGYLEYIIAAFQGASELIRYQHYLVDIQEHETRIATLLNQPLLLIPVAYEGHAITFVKYGHWLVKCDRGAASKREGSVVIYKIGNLGHFDNAFIKQLIYKKSNTHFILEEVPRLLKLTKMAELPIPSQLIGNCSWANVEASVPAMLFLLLWQNLKFNVEEAELKMAIETTMEFYQRWREWDKEIALHDCIESISYEDSDAARNASKAAILGAILFQRCHYNLAPDLVRAGKILNILQQPQYHYILQSYLKVYSHENRTRAGYNLQRLLEYFDIHFPH